MKWANVLFNIYDYMQFSIHKNNKPHKQLIFPNSHEYINIHRFYYVIN